MTETAVTYIFKRTEKDKFLLVYFVTKFFRSACKKVFWNQELYNTVYK